MRVTQYLMSSDDISQALGEVDVQRPLKVETCLGSGSYSNAWTIKGVPGAVAIIRYDLGYNDPGCDIEGLKEQDKWLRDLKMWGVPTLEVFGIYRFKGLPPSDETGNKAWGLVVRRMAASDRYETENRKTGSKFHKYLNQTSLEDLLKMRQVVETKKIHISDFQVLVGYDGHLVVADPLEIGKNSSEYDWTLKSINQLIERVKGKLERQSKRKAA